MTIKILDVMLVLWNLVIFIPACYIGKLQVLNISINRPFKLHNQENFEFHMIECVNEENTNL